jgi:predicted ATPase/DNA-binding winged helix-turn-helix (wHTH) protein
MGGMTRPKKGASKAHRWRSAELPCRKARDIEVKRRQSSGVYKAHMPHSFALGTSLPSCRPEGARVEAFHFGHYRVLPRERRLECNGRRIPIGGRALDILIALLDRSGEVVSKTELCEAAWPNMVVEEASLRFHIVSLRKALGEHERATPLLTTVAGRGYCFSGDVSVRPMEACGDQRPEGPASPKLRHLFGDPEARTAAITKLLEKRFLTLIGPAGIGKTTLALHIGAEASAHFTGGVACVDLSAIKNADQVVETIDAVLVGARDERSAPEATAAALGEHHKLLILDGCEHLIGTIADQAERLLQQHRGLSILATSREALRADGEHVHRLLPLDCPPAGALLTAEQAKTYHAVDFFIDRVECGQLGYRLSDADVPYVTEICRKLDGIPLALELVAGQVSAYGLRQTAVLIDSRMRLHWRGRRTAPSRHQTLSAALDWSYFRLSSDELLLLQHISAVEGYFTFGEACAAALDRVEAMAEALATLVAKSLIIVEAIDATTRYRLLETTRIYLRDVQRTPDVNTVVLNGERNCLMIPHFRAADRGGSISMPHFAKPPAEVLSLYAAGIVTPAPAMAQPYSQ